MKRAASSTARDIDVFGLRIQDTTLHGAAETIVSSAAAGANLRVGFVNAHCVNEMHKNTHYRSSLEGFDILYADGMGMRIAATAVGETLAVTLVIGNRVGFPETIFSPTYTMASVIANQFAEVENDLHRSALLEVGLLLLIVTFFINVGARLLVWRVTRGNRVAVNQ